MKKVTIVIPTRQRAHLLKFALKSAVLQTYKNLEIVVCDNYSQDNTREVADSFGSDRIVYVRTDKVLSMADNWEFALTKATGDYITILTDDSYLLPNAIEIAVDEMANHGVDVAVWKHCSYFSPDWLEKARRNIVYLPNTTNKSYRFNSENVLQKLFSMEEGAYIISPRSLNSLCCRSVIENAKNRQGRFFLPTCPDFASAAGVLLNSDNYVLIDKPLFLDSVTDSSIGASASFNLGQSAQDAIKEYDGGLDDIMFLGIPVSPGSIAKTLDTVRKFYLDDCPEIDVKNLLCVIADRLLKLEANGVDVSSYWKKFNKYASSRTIDIKIAILKQKVLSKIKWMIIKVMRSYPKLEYFESLRNVRILKGKDWKFNNIEEAAKVIISIKP